MIELSFADTSSSLILIFRVSRIKSPLMIKQRPSLNPIAMRVSCSTSKTVTITCGRKVLSCGVVWHNLMVRMQEPIGVLFCSLGGVDSADMPASWKRFSSLFGVSADSLIRHIFNTGTRSSLSVPIVTRNSLPDGGVAAAFPLGRLLMAQQCVTATLYAEKEYAWKKGQLFV